MVSSDESDSESSFVDSNDSDDEGESGNMATPMELTKSTHASRIGVKQVTPPKNSMSSAKGDAKAAGSKNKDSGETEDLLPGWTGAEVTYFRLLHPVFGHNYCAIAELLQTKKCQEVFEYSQKVSGTLLLDQPERVRRLGRLAGKKKKRNMRYSPIEHVLLFSVNFLGFIQVFGTEGGGQWE